MKFAEYTSSLDALPVPACLCKSADETVFIPAELIDHIPLLFLFFFQICNIICIAFILRKFLQR